MQQKCWGEKKKLPNNPPPSPSLNTLPHTPSLIKTLAVGWSGAKGFQPTIAPKIEVTVIVKVKFSAYCQGYV